MLEHFRNADQSRGDHGSSCCHRFEDDRGKDIAGPFLIDDAREGEDVTVLQMLFDLVLTAHSQKLY